MYWIFIFQEKLAELVIELYAHTYRINQAKIGPACCRAPGDGDVKSEEDHRRGVY